MGKGQGGWGGYLQNPKIRKAKKKNKVLKLFASNSAGIKRKMESLVRNVSLLSPSIVMLQETKLYRKGQIKIDNYDTFERVRVSKEGLGGRCCSSDA